MVIFIANVVITLIVIANVVVIFILFIIIAIIDLLDSTVLLYFINRLIHSAIYLFRSVIDSFAQCYACDLIIIF